MGELDEEDKSPQDMTDDELVTKITQDIKDYSTHYTEWRATAKEDYDFFAGKQWNDEDAQLLEAQGRPAVVFNRIARTINAVTGLELQNRQEVNFKPMTLDDQGVNDLMNQAAKWVRSTCDAEDEESEAFQDTLICGVGCTETSMDYSSDPDGMVIVERRDPFEVAVDHRSKKRNFDDARWSASWKSYSKCEFEALYPDSDVEGKEINFWDNDGQELVGHADDEYKHGPSDDSASKDEAYTVIKYQYSYDEPFYRVAAQGQLISIEAEKYKLIEPHLEAMGLKPGVVQKKRIYKQIIMCRSTILERAPSPIDGFSLRFITGLRDRNKNTWFGLVSLMKDPQRWANKWLSQIQFILNSSAKNGYFYEADAFTNPKKAKAEHAQAGSWTEVNPGAIANGKIQPKVAPPYPEGIDRLLQHALQSINDVPGVNVEMLGIADRNQPGMIENSRKEAGVTILASFFDALRRYRKEQGRVLSQFIQRYISDGRLIRLDNINGPKYAKLLKDSLTAKYDILVDDAPTSPNMKEKVFGTVSQMLQIALQAGIPIPPEILEYSPLPAALVEKWMKLINDEKANPAIQEKQDLEKKAAETNIQKMGSEVAKNQSQAKLNEVKAIKELSPEAHGMGEMDLHAEKLKTATSAIKAQAEVEKSQNDIKKELIKGAMNLHKANLDSKKAFNQPTSTA